MAPFVTLLPDLLTYTKLAAFGGILVVIATLYQAFFAAAFYPTLPLACEPAGRRWFTPRTRWRYYTDCAAMFNETYQKFSKKGKAVLVPSVGLHSEMIMPTNSLEWAMTQPDDVLSVSQAFLELNQTVYSLGHERYWGDPWQFSLVKMHLNSILPILIPMLNDELQHAFEKYFGTDTETWREIPLEHTLRKVVAQASSRFIVGEALCRNEEYLDRSYRIIDGVMVNIFATIPYPRFLRPILGRIASLHTHHNIRRIQNLLEPLYKERLALLTENDKQSQHQPQDLLMMMLRFAQKKRPQELNDQYIIARRVCASSFVAMHQTTIAATNMILNIIGTNAEFNTIHHLREETMRVLGGTDGANWTRDQFSQMTKTDSVARETMRLNSPFGTRGSMRKVMKDGVVTKDGIALQKGTVISFLAAPAQTDPDQFENALSFDPFRFSRTLDGDPVTTGEKSGVDRETFVTTSSQYLPFGHGKHACPGRFMVDVELKMMAAYLLTHYDIDFPLDYRGKQPPSSWVAELCTPPPGARIRVKKRKEVT